MGGALPPHSIRVVSMRDESYPAVLVNDPEPPAVLFVRGDLSVLDSRRVGVVGTRNATRAGRETALELGRELAAAGVVVVSGLAKGIDGAAHHGVLRADGAPPAAVVGNGPDAAVPAGACPAVGGGRAGAVSCCRSGRRAPFPSRSASRCATASSPRSARCSSSWRAASGAAR